MTRPTINQILQLPEDQKINVEDLVAVVEKLNVEDWEETLTKIIKNQSTQDLLLGNLQGSRLTVQLGEVRCRCKYASMFCLIYFNDILDFFENSENTKVVLVLEYCSFS
jgi:hypothetical protein